jgi:lactoylglutathione lyase
MRLEAAMEFVHVATRTRDLDAAIAFYEALGLRLDPRSDLTKNKATLAFMAKPDGAFAIELVYNWGKDTPYDGGERFGHFAFHVDDLDDTYKRVLEGGGQEVGRPPAPLQGEGPRIAFVADPDGNWIELIERH